MKWYFEKSNGGRVYSENGDTIKRIDVEPFLNKTQQLKAEIAAYADVLEREISNGLKTKHEFIIGRLRQLSAV